MPWRGPEFDGEYPTLGWQVGDFIEAYCRVPSGPLAGQPIRLTNEQWRFVLRLYAVHPVTCKRLVRRATLRRSKKWGKSPLTAGLAFAHLCGPTEPDGWNAAGEPVGRAHLSPWVQLAATAEDQTDNVMSPLINMLRESDALADLGVDMGRGTEATTRILLTGRPGKIEPVTAKAGTREGQLITAAILDQTEGWLAKNGGLRLARTIRRNLAPQGGLSIDTPNAHVPGEGSVAELAFKAWEDGVEGLLYDHREAPDVEDLADDAAVRAALEFAYGDSVAFVDIDRLMAERNDPEMTPGDFRRWYLNQARAPEDDVTGAERWAELSDPTLKLLPGDIVALGFDGSESGDGSAIYACRWPDWAVFRIGYWQRPDDLDKRARYRIPRGEVDDVLRAAFADYRVVRMLCDPPYWQKEIDEWSGIWPDTIFDWPTKADRRAAGMANRWEGMVDKGTLRHDGDALLTQHLANARRESCADGWRPAKKGTGRIDAVVAAMNAVEALGQAVDKGLLPSDVELDVEAMVV